MTLCRSSNLYTCLRASHLYDEYYDYHSKLNNHFYSDRLIYSRDITVFKDDNAIPVALPRENWFNVDVITCSAPYLGGSKYTNPTVLRHLFQSRMRNILEAALDNKAETIVLGAFGCGAFKNPARLVAEEFKSVIENSDYTIKGLVETMAEIADIPVEMFADAENDFITVVSNNVKMYGAAMVLNPTVKALLSEKYPNGYFLLPSSIHEMLAVSKDMMSIDEFKEMVRDVNCNEVAEEDLLSDEVYKPCNEGIEHAV